jgi:transcriptional regulator with XRE-family HTH domain
MTTFRHPVPILVQRSLAALGGRVAVARKARGLTQVQLAFSADVGVSTVAALEGGHHGVSLGNLLKVLAALDLLAQVDDWLLPERDAAVLAYATDRLAP